MQREHFVNVGMGDVLAVKVIGMIKLLDKGEADNKVIAVDPDGPFKDVDDLKYMLLKNPNVIPIVKQWFDVIDYHHGAIHDFQDIVVLQPKNI